MSMKINQKVACLIDGNNIAISGQKIFKDRGLMFDVENTIPRIVGERELSKLYFFREGITISRKFTEKLQRLFYGICIPCNKSADSVLTMTAIQISDKVDTIIIFSGDIDYVPLIRFLKSNGVRIEIASLYASTSPDLVKEVDYWHELKRDSFFQFIPNDAFHNGGSDENSIDVS